MPDFLKLLTEFTAIGAFIQVWQNNDKKNLYVCEGTANVFHKCCSLFIEAVRKERHCCRLEGMSGFWRQSR